MINCTECSSKTSQPISDVWIIGTVVVKGTENLCRSCFDRRMAKARLKHEKEESEACSNRNHSRRSSYKIVPRKPITIKM